MQSLLTCLTSHNLPAAANACHSFSGQFTGATSLAIPVAVVVSLAVATLAVRWL